MPVVKDRGRTAANRLLGSGRAYEGDDPDDEMVMEDWL